MSIINNPILRSDSYKYSHFKQYPSGTTRILSYIEPRHTKLNINEVVHFGTQIFIKDRLMKPFTASDVKEAQAFMAEHGEPFNYEGYMYIVEKHGGMFPVNISAVPEGMPVPLGCMMVKISNTDEQCSWATSMLETELLQAVWYGSTVATISRECKRIIKAAMERTGADLAGLPFKLHDFGYRGVSSPESAGIGGAAHLINFLGSDTIRGIVYANQFYNAGTAGFSIPAAEHSTITSWGKENEVDAYANMVDKFAKPGAIFAVVIDSYNPFEAIQKMHERGLFDRVKNAGATMVLRPDSGDPHKMPLDVIRNLMNYVGFTTNQKCFDVLPPHIRVIQGDGITIDSIPVICNNMVTEGFSMDNLAFGMGGGLLQHCNRDTFGFAMKCSQIEVNGVPRDVYKETPGKKSKRGDFDVYRNPVTNMLETGQVSPETKTVNHTVYAHNGAYTATNFSNWSNVLARAIL